LHQGLRYDPALITYDNRGRAYHPDLMRFLQNDPLGFGAGDVDLYRAESDNPTDRVDPSGMDGTEDLQNRLIWGKYGIDILSSKTFGQLLDAEDQFFAGWSNKLTAGGSNWLREQIYGETATQNHGGYFYDAGDTFGGLHVLALSFASGEGWAAQAAGLYFAGLDSYYGTRAAINIGAGEGTWQDWLQLGLSAFGLGNRASAACKLPSVTDAPARGAAASPAQRRVLYHYTDEAGMTGITESGELRPSLRANNARDVRYGEGQYLSDFAPGTKTPAQLSREFLGQPFQGRRFTHYVEIDVTGLNAVQGRNGVFVVPGNQPLDLTGRIVGSGTVPPVGR
jgi:RHS repeat-associated protein